MSVLRLTLAWFYAALVSLLGFCFCLLRPFNPANNHFIARLYAWGGRSILGVRTHVEGREHLEGVSPRIVVANHQYNDDIFLLGDLVPRRGVIVGKAGLRWIPLFGQMFWLGGNVLIDRSRGQAAKAAIAATAEAMERGRKSVWVFPEGTRSQGRGLLPFKRGAFVAAVAAQVPIVMICTGTYRSGSQRQAPVFIRVLAPIPTTGLSEADVPALIADCHGAMRTAIDELDHKATMARRESPEEK